MLRAGQTHSPNSLHIPCLPERLNRLGAVGAEQSLFEDIGLVRYI